MGRICTVCISPHREFIDDCIVKGWERKEIYRELLRRYGPGNVPSYQSIIDHARTHVKAVVQAAVERDAFRLKTIKEEIARDVSISRQLRQNLELCNDQISRIVKETDMANPEARGEVRDIISRLNQTIELLLRFSDKVEVKATQVDLSDRVLYCLRDFPPDLVETFMQRWKEIMSEESVQPSL